MKICYDSKNISFAVGNLHYICVERPAGYKVSFPDGRKQHSFLYTTCGSMRYIFYNSSGRIENTMEAPAGDLVFIPAGTIQDSLYTGSANTVEIVQFDCIFGDLPDYLNAPIQIQNGAIEKIYCSICTDIRKGLGENAMFFLSRIYELLWHISENHTQLPSRYRKLQLALKELHLYYADNRKIRYYSDLSGMSEPGFRRLFKEYTGLSPIDYRNHLRLEEAKKLLASGEFSVEEVSLQVGFSNLPFFCRSYKKRFGKSPGRDQG